MANKDVSIVIPAYNEQENIYPLLIALWRHVGRCEIVVVDDGDDDTGVIAESLGARVIRGQGKGLGQAIIDGIAESRNPIVLVMDADLQHDPAEAPRLIEPIQKKGIDFVIGSKYVKGGNTKGWSLFRWLVSTVSGYFWLPFLGIHDANSGYFAFHKRILDGVQLKPNSWKIMLEVLLRGKWIAKEEVPITFGDRQHGESKNSLKQAAILTVHMLKLMMLKYQGMLKYGVVGATGALVHFGLLFLLTDIVHLHYLVSAIIAVITTTTFNYTLNHFWTFERRHIKGGWFIGWVKYEIIDEISDVVYLGQLALFVEVFGIWYIFAAMLATTINYPIRYMIFKKLVWGRKKTEAKVSSTDADFEWKGYYQGNILRRSWKRAIVKDIADYMNGFRAGKVLDYGCGSSPLPAVVKHGSYVGIDINAGKIAFMKSREIASCKFICGDEEALNNCPDDYYDFVLCIEVLEHLDWVPALVSGLAKKLKRNGVLILATPEKESLLWRIIERAQKILQPTYHTSGHQRLYTRDELDILCLNNGLRNSRMKHIALGMDRLTYYRKAEVMT